MAINENAFARRALETCLCLPLERSEVKSRDCSGVGREKMHKYFALQHLDSAMLNRSLDNFF